MTSLRIRCLLLVFVSPAVVWAAKSKLTSEILTPVLRQAPVELAARLTRAPATEAPPASLKSPFSPPEFDRPTPEEAKLAAAKAAAAGLPAPSAPSASAASGAPAAGTPAASSPAATKAAPASDREMLELVAARIPSTGVIIFGRKPLLVVGGKRYEIGNRFTVTHAGQDYELELVAIDRTTFTLRYRGEQYARPIILR